jgi:hypothetical protein
MAHQSRHESAYGLTPKDELPEYPEWLALLLVMVFKYSQWFDEHIHAKKNRKHVHVLAERRPGKG